jgi:hypothetical protein
LHFLGVLDVFGITVTPFQRNFGILVGIDQDIEGAVAIKHGQECDGSCDLAEDGLDLLLDVLICLFICLLGCAVAKVSKFKEPNAGVLSYLSAFSSTVLLDPFFFDSLPNICT